MKPPRVRAVGWLLPLMLAGSIQCAPATAAPVLRVCADPNNLPFSNAAGQGFENRLAQLVGRQLGERVEYTWWAQRRGFFRHTLKAGLCDVVMGVPTGLPMATTTQPYYRSSYVMVYRKDRAYGLHTLDDPRLERLKIGVHVLGGDAPPPPALALARMGMIDNVVGYSIYGDYRQPHPPSRLIDAVAQGKVDVAIAWGPLVGYFARHAAVPLEVVPLTRSPLPALPFDFSISMGVRKGDDALKNRLDKVLTTRRGDIQALLDEYAVPQLDEPRARAVSLHP